MPHDTPLIATIAGAFLSAWVLGSLASRLGLSPIVGYLLAGVVIGPHTPGFVADAALAAQLAEIGVVLLMFGVGLHFHPRDLLAVKGIAIPGALVQSACATLLGIGTGLLFGWSASAGLVLGLALSVASTVVLMRSLEERLLLETPAGHIAVGLAHRRGPPHRGRARRDPGPGAARRGAGRRPRPRRDSWQRSASPSSSSRLSSPSCGWPDRASCPGCWSAPPASARASSSP